MASAAVTKVSPLKTTKSKDNLVDKEKKKGKKLKLSNGRIRNVRFVRNWESMDGKKLTSAANTFLSMLLFREVRNIVSDCQVEVLENEGRTITPNAIQTVARLRLSRRERKDYDSFRLKMYKLLEAEVNA